LAQKKLYALCMDVGGTSLKTGIVRNDGLIIKGSVAVEPVNAAGNKEEILNSFAESLKRGINFALAKNLSLAGAGISIGGPFDYEQGISKIKDLDKYEALYNVNVKQELRERLNLSPDFPFLFDVDAWAFGRGEAWSGAAQKYHRVIILTMGTGMGSAFAVSGKIVSQGPGVPWYGWIAGQKHRDGILNDYVSRAYMIRQYEKLSGEKIDVKEMAERADRGDSIAATVFIKMGEELGNFLAAHNVPDFKPDCIIFGGQISRAFHLFKTPVIEALKIFPFIHAVLPAVDIEGSALKGTAKYIFDTLS